jgi:hypothetical protein
MVGKRGNPAHNSQFKLAKNEQRSINIEGYNATALALGYNTKFYH